MEPQTTYQLIVPLAFILLGSGALVAIYCGKQSNSRLLSGFLIAACLLLLSASFLSWPAGFSYGPMPIFLGGLVPLSQKADCLSLFFLAILAFVALAVAMFSPAYLDHLKGRCHLGIYWFALFVFIGSMVQVFLSPDAITFIVFWELMSLSSVALVLTDQASHKAHKAAVIYLGATRVSTTLIFAGFLWLHALSGSWIFADWHGIGAHALVPLAIVFTGLCIKAGTWPFHLWLPYAHTEAPAPISALMSGVMVKVAVYGMIRLVLMNDCQSVALAYFAVVLGAISSFWGIMFAQVESDIKRLLAYSTVENVGLIVLAMGLALLAKGTDLMQVASIALAGCLFHVLNHGLYKSLLFLSAGAVDCGAHSRDLAKLGGLQKMIPWTAAAFFFGSIAICALPPLNGFASKWLIYQGLFNFSVSSGSILDRALGITTIGLLAMIGAMSIASFTKAFGLCFLGPVRSPAVEKAKEMPPAACWAQALLMAACVVLSVDSTLVIQWLAPIANAILPKYTIALTLPQPQLVVALLVLVPAFYVVLSNFARRNVKYFSTWECGYGFLPVRSVIGALSFSRPLASVFDMVIQFHPTNQISGRDRRHFPDAVDIKVDQVLLLEKLVYGPILRALDAIGKGLIKLQTGSIHIHLLYVFATLIVLVIFGTQR
jgi:formate hydrogenlyase subunit 3/multisubunit Na+/H+ antiporter MnhD subunit